MANTPNYGLYKPSRADISVEVDTSLANNFTTIDTKMKENADNLTAHKNNALAHTSENISHADGSVKSILDNHEERITQTTTNINTLVLPAVASQTNSITNLDGRVTAIELSGGGSGGTVDLTPINAQLATKVSSTNITNVRDNSNALEYSLDGGSVWKPATNLPIASASTLGGVKIGSGISVDGSGVISVAGGGGSAAPNVKYLDNYSSLSSGDTNWSPAFTQAFTDLGASGGIVQLGAKQYNIGSTITIPSNVHIRGISRGITTIRLNNGVNADMVTLSNNQNCGISHLTIYGNAFDASPASGKNGLVIGKAGLDVINGTMNNIEVHDLYIRSIGGNGFYCFQNTWVYAISRINVDFCTGYGAYIQSTDNEYDTINITGNNLWGLYVTGSNNRFTSMKIIFNGRGAPSAGKYYGNGNDIASAGAYITGKRNTFVNIEAQENYGHGFVFDGAVDTDLMGVVSDKNGYIALAPDGTSVTGTPSAVGYYFMNGASRINGSVKATNFSSSLKSQLYGYHIDSTCQNIALDYEQDTNIVGINANLSLSSVVSTGDKKANVFMNGQVADFMSSGITLTNKITAYNTTVFQTAITMMEAGSTFTGSEFSGRTNWGQSSPRMGTKSTLTTSVGRIYLARVRLKPVVDNYVLKVTAYWDEAPYNGLSTAGTVTTTCKSGVYTDASFIFRAGRTSSALGFWVEDMGLNATQGAFAASEFAVIDITDVVMNYFPKTIDKVVSKKYFLGSKTFSDADTPTVLDSGTTANRPLMPVVGRVYFDTTLGKPVYCKTGGTTPVWVDSAGTTV